MRRLPLLLALASCLNPDELQHTGCSKDADCPRTGEQCCEGFCRATCSPQPGVDAGRDAGPPDAGPPDAGPPDAGPPDAGPPDAGPPDAGPPDAGPPDA